VETILTIVHREDISGTAGPIFTIFCADPLWLWLGPPLAPRCDMLCTFGFMNDVTIGRSGPYAWKAEPLTYYH